MNFIINLEIKEMFKSTALILLYIVFVSIGVLMIIRWYVNQKLIKNLTIVIHELKKSKMGIYLILL